MCKEQCPVCGTYCKVHTGGEGTGCFIPADAEIERLTKELDELAASNARLRDMVGRGLQLARICTDWNLDEVEIDSVMVPTHELIGMFEAGLEAEAKEIEDE